MDKTFTTDKGDRFTLGDRIQTNCEHQRKGVIVGLCAGAALVEWDDGQNVRSSQLSWCTLNDLLVVI